MAHKEDDDDIYPSDVYINPEDGMPNTHPNIAHLQLEQESDSHDADNEWDDLPKSVIVTGIPNCVFTDDKLKQELEELFRPFSKNATFLWLRSFRRLRVDCDTSLAAVNARIQLHQFPFHGSRLNCYFAQPVSPVAYNNLRPPAPVKQFLISPPASPPVGWEPKEEGEPIINEELLIALSNLTPGECRELHPPTSNTPGIVVHTALAPDPNAIVGTRHIPQTRCPKF